LNPSATAIVVGTNGFPLGEGNGTGVGVGVGLVEGEGEGDALVSKG
jgi:hypothetical protein